MRFIRRGNVQCSTNLGGGGSSEEKSQKESEQSSGHNTWPIYCLVLEHVYVFASISVSTRACHDDLRAKAGFDSQAERIFSMHEKFFFGITVIFPCSSVCAQRYRIAVSCIDLATWSQEWKWPSDVMKYDRLEASPLVSAMLVSLSPSIKVATDECR